MTVSSLHNLVLQMNDLSHVLKIVISQGQGLTWFPWALAPVSSTCASWAPCRTSAEGCAPQSARTTHVGQEVISAALVSEAASGKGWRDWSLPADGACR